MKIVQVTMKCELAAGAENFTRRLKDALDGLNRLGLQYQVQLPEFISEPTIITAVGQAGKVESALRMYGAVLTLEQRMEVRT